MEIVTDERGRIGHSGQQHTSTPSGWKAWVTPQMIFTAVCMVFAAGGYWQTFQAMRERVTNIEERLNEMERQNRETYMRRDVLAEQLSRIQLDLITLHEEVKDVKTEVRKIR